MRRAIIVIVILLMLSIAAIIVIDMRVKGEIVLPSERPSQPAKVAKGPAKSEVATIKEGKKEPNAEPIPAPEGESPTEETNGPPEGYIWWGGYTILKEAKIPSAHLDSDYWFGYGAPVSYANDGKLIVASKYANHRSCLWSYDLPSNGFTVLFPKTRNMVLYLANDMPWMFGLMRECVTPRQMTWVESSKEYQWDYRNDLRRHVRGSKELKTARLGNNRNEDECYSKGWDTTGLMFRMQTEMDPAVYPLNKGALELTYQRNNTHVGLPFLNDRITFFYKFFTTVSLRDTITKRVISTRTLGAGDYCLGLHDFGDGLFVMFVQSLRQHSAEARVLLVRYPELRVIGCDTLPKRGEGGYCRRQPSIRDGLAVDVVSCYPRSEHYVGPKPQEDDRGASQRPSFGPLLLRIRVPQGWREAPGRVRQDLLWDDDTKGCMNLDITEMGVFDLDRWDAYSGSFEEDDPFPENFSPSYVWRDGVMYWRKRHTGEVVMAEAADFSKQTVIGGAGTTWDGFRLNPVRDELVTWRENGELVFWNVQFPTADPVYRARVITDETPHRLEAMQ